MLRTTLTLATCAVLLSAGAASADPCRIEAYQPGPMFREIMSELPGVGIAALPATVDSTVMPAGRITLIRSGALVGQVTYASNPREGTAAFLVYDAAGAVLMEVRQNQFVCQPPLEAPGLCTQVTMANELQPMVEGRPPFLMTLEPDSGYLANYFRFGAEVDFYTWHYAYAQALGWLRSTLLTTQNVVMPAMVTAEQRVFWSLASDPVISPYLAGLTVTYGGDGRLHLLGVVPSTAVYNLIVQRVIAAGYPNLAADMIIDTAAVLPSALEPVAGACPPY